MKRLQVFESEYKSALRRIESYLTFGDDIIQPLVKLMLNTDISQYGVYPRSFAGAFTSAQDFAELCSYIHIAVENSNITFFIENGEPRFGFFPNSELNNIKRATSLSHPAVTDYSMELVEDFSEWMRLFDAYYSDRLYENFITESARYGVEFSLKNYETCSKFNPTWIHRSSLDISNARTKLYASGLMLHDQLSELNIKDDQLRQRLMEPAHDNGIDEKFMQQLRNGEHLRFINEQMTIFPQTGS